VARALIVGCGCLGTELGRALANEGWAVRGTSRTQEGAARIDAADIEGVVADPDRVGTVLEHVGDVAVVVWALGAASGPSAEAVNGPRLESMLGHLVDTPVRGFVLDAPGSPEAEALATAASETWRLPVRVISADREGGPWVEEARAAVSGLIGS
jgi:3-hydroxyisobutyrate dehydrogenase-like beta-hydroxyacid dehydrogenase